MEITQKKKPPGSLDNLHPGIDVNAKIIGRFSPFLMSAIGH
ncbi:hypothetical protein [Escherichia coli]|nr:hypothetical protein [Escherichia coli]MDO2630013.1 hypothetical protein [Escherichia coli]MDO2663657.1 hypothetical protein [Escherichia coli]